MNILEGKGTKAQNDVVIANAAIALNLVFPEKMLTECVGMAKESILSGRAMQKFRGVTNY